MIKGVAQILTRERNYVMSSDEMRLVLTVDDFEQAVAFFRDRLGLNQLAVWQNDGGHAVLLDAGRATLEIFDEAQARAIDEVEVGRRVAGEVRVAFRPATASPWRAILSGRAPKSLAARWPRRGATGTCGLPAQMESSSRSSPHRSETADYLSLFSNQWCA